MKPTLKVSLIFVALFAVVVLPMMIKGGDGKPIMSPEDWFPNGERLIGWVREWKIGADRLFGSSENNNSGAGGQQGVDDALDPLKDAPTSLSPESGKMYKWQDKNGKWHFSSEKPTHRDSVTMESLPDVKNVMEPPVGGGSDDSMIAPTAGEILEKIQRMTQERKN